VFFFFVIFPQQAWFSAQFRNEEGCSWLSYQQRTFRFLLRLWLLRCLIRILFLRQTLGFGASSVVKLFANF